MAWLIWSPGMVMSSPTRSPELAMMAAGSARAFPSTEIPRILETSWGCWACWRRWAWRGESATRPNHIANSPTWILLIGSYPCHTPEDAGNGTRLGGVPGAKLFADHAETPFAVLVVPDRLVEMFAPERGPESRGDVHLGIGQLPEQEVADPEFPAAADQEVGVGDAPGRKSFGDLSSVTSPAGSAPVRASATREETACRRSQRPL